MGTDRLKVAIIGNQYQALSNLHIIEGVLRKLSKIGLDILIEADFYNFLWQRINADMTRFRQFEGRNFEADFAVSIGGDGTFLHAAALVGDKGTPIAGINMGRLGFLADIAPLGINEAIEAMRRGDYVVEKRSVIAVEKSGEPLNCYPFALNEVAVLKHDNSSLIEIQTSVNGELLNNYMADGLIVCTPTGSTGYSLSVGGPIMVPRSHTFCISAVAPHSLSSRPVILCDDVCISLSVKSRSHNFLVSVDGRSESFPDDTVLQLRRAPYEINVIKIKHKHFFDTLREKMMWGVDQRF